MKSYQNSKTSLELSSANLAKYTEIREVEILRKAKRLLEAMRKPDEDPPMKPRHLGRKKKRKLTDSEKLDKNLLGLLRTTSFLDTDELRKMIDDTNKNLESYGTGLKALHKSMASCQYFNR